MGFALSSRRGYGALPRLWIVLFAAVLGAAAYLGIDHSSSPERHAQSSKYFAACGYFTRDDCVVDGDTFFMNHDKIRIADIDAPETHGAKCAAEAELGMRATKRLRELLNSGPFELRGYGTRDRDRYGRKLRIVVLEGRSIGDIMIDEGLARRWNGTRRPWCA